MDPSTLSGMDIIRIYPTNDVAKECFNDLIAKKLDGTINKHHGQFVVHSGTGILDKDYQPSDSAIHGSENEGTRRVNLGYFRIGLNTPSFQAGIRWVMGKGINNHGDRRVDILLADPKSTQGSFLKQPHLFLQMHLQSGAWILRASGPAELDDELMPTIGGRCLHKHRTDLKVCGLRFRIDFAIANAEDEKIYVSDRNKWMSAHGVPIPTLKGSGIPFMNDTKLESAVFRTGLGSGSYGTVFEGFSPVTGSALAIKRIGIKNSQARAPVANEIKALEELNGTMGIIKVHQIANSLGRANPLSGDFPYDVYIVQSLGRNMKEYEWDRENRESPDYGLHVNVLRQLLQGVYAIHKQGWMHRDITRQNIVYFPGIDAGPPRAALIDFGKVCFRSASANTCIAAWPNVPPEVVTGKDSNQGVVYDQKIDIWMLALSLAHCWFPKQMLPEGTHQTKTTDLLNNLAEFKHIPLVAILMRMLLPDPHSRPGAAEILRCSIFGTKARTANSEDLSHEKRPAGRRAVMG